MYMKNALIAVLTLLLVCAPLYAYDDHRTVHRFSDSHNYHGCMLDDLDVDIDDGSIIIEERGFGHDEVEITSEHELYVNGKLVKLDKDQQELVGRFYDQTFELIDYATEIGIEGAKIGAQGAAVGIHALTKLFKLLDSDYDTEDYEQEIEAKADELEAKADELDKKADEVEHMADRLEDLFYEMSESIPELRDLNWTLSDSRNGPAIIMPVPPAVPGEPAVPAAPAAIDRPRIPE
jgi:hypothetical protein